MIWFYRAMFLPALILSAPYYGMRMLRRGGYGLDFSHRFGKQKNLPEPQGKKRIWIQAVSVGEVEALAPLLEKLWADDRIEVVITTTTSTAYKIVREKYAQKCLYTGVFPFDFLPFSNAAWNKIKPDLAILMEGELWPEHMHQAVSRKIPLLLINARMSDKSFRRYSRFPLIARRILRKLTRVAASGEFDMNRLISLGVPVDKIFCAGNLKFDSKPAAVLDDAGKLALRKELGFPQDAFVLLGSSTWDGEEKMLLEATEKIRAKGIDCRLLLVPRHAERRAQIIELLKDIPHCVRSEKKQADSDNTIVYLADTTGELRMLTQVADIAFVGKSLPPNVGGQTPIDCAALSVPMVYGPNMTNFRRICETLESETASIKVPNAESAIEEIVRLAQNKNLRQELAFSAKRWHTSNIGATERVYGAILQTLEL